MKVLKTAKKLQRKKIIYLKDSIDLGAEINFQVLAMMIDELDIFIYTEKYEILKGDKEELLNALAISCISVEDLIYKFPVDFKMNIIKDYFDIEDPVIIEETCFFFPRYMKKDELYDKAIVQINEGKFENIMF